MVLDLAKFKKECVSSLAVMLILGIITLVLAPFTGHYRGLYLCSLLGIIIVFASGAYLFLVYGRAAKDIRDIAVPTMQSLWVSTSMGLGYIVTALAPYFQISATIAAVLFIVGWCLLLFGAYRLVTISKKTGIPLAV
ncbi:MAG: hypothetical protein H5T34_07540 [Candidatus Methanomethyliales bacterium]|nr:hypothetical protein [Candidatus Methanomethylicales archaeon]